MTEQVVRARLSNSCQPKNMPCISLDILMKNIWLFFGTRQNYLMEIFNNNTMETELSILAELYCYCKTAENPYENLITTR